MTLAIHLSLQAVHNQIECCCEKAARPKESVRLVAVSKTKALADIQAAFAAGQREFGESYVQEALAKISAYRPAGIVWHFIGHIQSNKTKAIAEHFDWVQSVNRLSIAERLSQQRPKELPVLNICIQVNIDNEATKSGAAPVDVSALAHAIQRLPNLRLRGLMAIPAKKETVAEQRKSFQQLRQLFHHLRQEGHNLDTLSMGMSEDFEAAIFEGATMVRIGSRIFGERIQ